MTARQTIPPTTYGVTVEQAKAHARVLNNVENEVVELHLASALAFAEVYTGKRYEPQTWQLSIDAFPANEIELSPGPVASVVSVAYTDGDGLEETVLEGDYEVDLEGDDGWVMPAVPWPSTLTTINAVRVTYIAGRGTMPADMRQAIVMLAAHYYAEREGAAIPDGIMTILRRHMRYFV